MTSRVLLFLTFLMAAPISAAAATLQTPADGATVGASGRPTLTWTLDGEDEAFHSLSATKEGVGLLYYETPNEACWVGELCTASTWWQPPEHDPMFAGKWSWQVTGITLTCDPDCTWGNETTTPLRTFTVATSMGRANHFIYRQRGNRFRAHTWLRSNAYRVQWSVKIYAGNWSCRRWGYLRHAPSPSIQDGWVEGNQYCFVPRRFKGRQIRSTGWVRYSGQVRRFSDWTYY